MSESRSEFEAWFREGNGEADKWLAPHERHGEQYNDLTTDAMWDAWQASRRAALEQAAKLCDYLNDGYEYGAAVQIRSLAQTKARR